MKKEIQVFEYADVILKNVARGVLLTTAAGGRVNTMTISWGTLGIEWGKPIFTVFVRESRFTKGLLDRSGEFTINVPYGNVDPRILSFCGSKSGRDVDKLAALGLTPVPSEHVAAPGLRELPLTLECRVVYRQAQDGAAITAENRKKYYPQEVGGEFPGANRDYHTAYYGEIVGAYLLED